MTLLEYYLRYTGEMLEGKRPCPEGVTLTKKDDFEKAVELFSQLEKLGAKEVVRRCAEADGTAIPQES